MSLTNKINNLITSSNSTTGASDTTLINAITRLINGYGNGDDGGITKEIIIPQQILNTSIKTTNGYGAFFTDYVRYPIEGEQYLVTFDDVEYIAKAKNYSKDNALCIGDINVIYASSDSRLIFPFVVVLTTSNTFFLSTRTNANHTIKVEKIELIEDLNLIEKNITSNGTYTASSDNANGYSSITVNVVNQDYEDALVALGTQSDLTDSIEALTVYSNDITGEEDVNLSDAVHTLGSGYGQGGETDYDDVTLPSEYQRVEYIESSGTQFISLPFGFSPSDEIHAKAAIDTSMGVDKFMVCPQTWNNDNNRFGIIGLSGNTLQKRLGVAYGSIATNLSLMATQTTNDGLLHKYSYKNKFFWSDDLDIAYGTGAVTFGADTTNLKLFYGYNANTKGKIAYYVHKKENTSVALYACYRKADGVIGLYDVNNDVFYTNDGTGTFTKGADI